MRECEWLATFADINFHTHVDAGHGNLVKGLLHVHWHGVEDIFQDVEAASQPANGAVK